MDESDREINMRTLKRNDESIEHIVESANQVAVYKFNTASGEYDKHFAEGLFRIHFWIAFKTNSIVILS